AELIAATAIMSAAARQASIAQISTAMRISTVRATVFNVSAITIATTHTHMINPGEKGKI
ncbi:MAG: hypothetical protein JW941_05375, partial [Candidatus Coatesbacteria bacterium]|nr:hypothetical protein [Candidatus Coatesbacteria bacterium]